MTKYKEGLDCINWQQLFYLYDIVGLVAGYGKKKDYNKIRTAFEQSHKIVTAWNDDDNLIGAARMLSDGICYGMIFDVGVLPEYQMLGIGRGLITELQKDKQHLCIHLTATFGNEEFYTKLGFRAHKTAFAKYPYETDYLS